MTGRALATAMAIAAVALAGCGDDDKADTTAPTTPATPPAADTTTPPAGIGGLPPEFVECMKQQGYEITSADDVHSAPNDVLQMCFGAMHGPGQ